MASDAAATLKMGTACMLLLLLGQVLIMANPAVAENQLLDQAEVWNDAQITGREKEMAARKEADDACIKDKCDEDGKKQAEQSGRTADANGYGARKYYDDHRVYCIEN
ncbi:hypothetical protein ACP4OV_006727 [Aristida adscensionis]